MYRLPKRVVDPGRDLPVFIQHGAIGQFLLKNIPAPYIVRCPVDGFTRWGVIVLAKQQKAHQKEKIISILLLSKVFNIL
jgi:hypothetical protein